MKRRVFDDPYFCPAPVIRARITKYEVVFSSLPRLFHVKSGIYRTIDISAIQRVSITRSRLIRGEARNGFETEEPGRREPECRHFEPLRGRVRSRRQVIGSTAVATLPRYGVADTRADCHRLPRRRGQTHLAAGSRVDTRLRRT